MCVFHNEKYVKLLDLLLQSIARHGKLDSNTYILIYTSPELFSKINRFSTFNELLISVHQTDKYHSVLDACCSRLDIFDIPNIKNYKNIMYLDTDIIVCGDIKPLFNILTENKLYALREGTIDDSSDHWGKSLFSDEEMSIIENKVAFSTGAMVFRNCPEIRRLFDETKERIRSSDKSFETYEQPFLIYSAFKNGMYDNTQLNRYGHIQYTFRNNEYYYHHDTRFVHFAGTTGVPNDKYPQMVQYLEKLNQ